MPSETEVIRDNLYGDPKHYDILDAKYEDMPFFWLLSAHQETMWPLTAALNLDRAAKLPFASAYFFEFYNYYSDEEGYVNYVNTVYRDDKGNNQSVVLDCSKPDIFGGPRPCEAGAFKDFIG